MNNHRQQINAYKKKQATPKPVTDMMATMAHSASTPVETPVPIRRGRGRPPGQRKGQNIEPPSTKKSKTASLISKLRRQTSEDDSSNKKKQQNKPIKNQDNVQGGNLWQSGQQMRELLMNNSGVGISARGTGLFDSGMDGGDFVDVERDDELDVDLGNREEEDELSLVQIVDRLNKAAARNNQSRGNAAAGDQRGGVSQFFDPLDEDWANVFNSAQKKVSFSPVSQNFGASTSAGEQQTSVPGDETNNFFLQSILMMHQQQQQKEVPQTTQHPVFFVNQNATTAQQQQQIRINTTTPVTPMQFIIGGQQQQVVVPQSIQQNNITSPQAVVVRRPANAAPVTPGVQNLEGTPQPRFKLILVKNVSSARTDFKPIDQYDGHADGSSSSDDDDDAVEKTTQEDDALPSSTVEGDMSISSDPVPQHHQGLKRKRSDDDNDEDEVDSQSKRLYSEHVDVVSTESDNNMEKSDQQPDGNQSEVPRPSRHALAFDSIPRLQPRVHSLQSDSQASLGSSGSNEEEDDEDLDVDVLEDDDDDDGSNAGSKLHGTALVSLSMSQASQPSLLDDQISSEEGDDENDDDDDDSNDEDEDDDDGMECTLPKVVGEAKTDSSSDLPVDSQSKTDQGPTTPSNNEVNITLPQSEEKRKAHKGRVLN